MKNLKIHNISVFVVEANNKHLKKEGISLMASSSNHIYTSISAVPYGKPALKDAICFGESFLYLTF